MPFTISATVSAQGDSVAANCACLGVCSSSSSSSSSRRRRRRRRSGIRKSSRAEGPGRSSSWLLSCSVALIKATE
ncbi:hypothetical protein LEMLEM_LOCUS8815 [Lemmus lemmus]